jgi:hypothetical protein
MKTQHYLHAEQERTVSRSFQLALALAFLTGMWVSESRGQAPAPPVPAPAAEPAFLQELPRPADVPRSLMLPAPPQAQTGDADEAPYFQRDPLLDPPEFPQPGWFVAAEMLLTRPHVSDSLFGPETGALNVPGIGAVTVNLGSVPLDWTVAPKFSAGYRLPSGFGAFMLSYRFFDSQGTGFIPTLNSGLDAGLPTGIETSRLSLNQVDLDYTSREYTPNSWLGMRWWLGLRFTDFFFDATATEPGAGAGVINRVEATDVTLGIGPHAGVELDWNLGHAGLTFVNKVDLATSMAKTNQNFSASSSGPLTGAAEHDSRSTTIPYVNWQIGVGWQPASLPNATFFMGYQLEQWWNVGNNPSSLSRLNVTNQGIVWQAGWNF